MNEKSVVQYNLVGKVNPRGVEKKPCIMTKEDAEFLGSECIFRKFCKFLAGSFSAVSKPNFASKYAFESSRRDLHNALLCAAFGITAL